MPFLVVRLTAANVVCRCTLFVEVPGASGEHPLKKTFLLSFVTAGVTLAITTFPFIHRGEFSRPALANPTAASASEADRPAEPPRKRDSLNEEVRGLYVTSWVAGIKRFQEIADGVTRSGLNALVIDIKDCTGKVGYDSAVPFVAEIKAHEKRIRDLGAVLRYCRERNIHTIARIAVFQDPVLAEAKPELAVKAAGGGTWKDRKGQSWVDPAAHKVWQYNIDLAKEATARGFDEVQFDYVRFPTDGKLKGLAYPVYKGDVPKRQVIK